MASSIEDNPWWTPDMIDAWDPDVEAIDIDEDDSMCSGTTTFSSSPTSESSFDTVSTTDSIYYDVTLLSDDGYSLLCPLRSIEQQSPKLAKLIRQSDQPQTITTPTNTTSTTPITLRLPHSREQLHLLIDTLDVERSQSMSWSSLRLSELVDIASMFLLYDCQDGFFLEILQGCIIARLQAEASFGSPDRPEVYGSSRLTLIQLCNLAEQLGMFNLIDLLRKETGLPTSGHLLHPSDDRPCKIRRISLRKAVWI